MNKILDIEGHRVGLLEVLCYDRTVKGRRYFFCLCDCGRITSINRSTLISGDSQSCGCLRLHKNPELNIGDKYGHLIIVGKEPLPADHRRYRKYHCECNCGKTVTVRQCDLANGTVTSCGCLSRKRLTISLGERYGNLTIVEKANYKTHGKYGAWVCQCDCGNTTVVRGSHLKNMETLSCGCKSARGRYKVGDVVNGMKLLERLPSDKKQNSVWRIYCSVCEEEKIMSVWKLMSKIKGCGCMVRGRLIRGYHIKDPFIRRKYQATISSIGVRTLDFKLTEKDFQDIVMQPCTYCGVLPDKHKCLGIDRIDSGVGYTKTNCVPCCARCNMMKRHHDVYAWLELMERIVSRKATILTTLSNFST